MSDNISPTKKFKYIAFSLEKYTPIKLRRTLIRLREKYTSVAGSTRQQD
jgi:hypothetical protein